MEGLNSITWSAIISGIALVAAVLSPVITTILTNRHQDKVWVRENYTRHKAEVIERYVQNTGVALKEQLAKNLENYGNSFGEIFFYVPKELWPLIETIDAEISAHCVTQKSQDVFTELCKELAQEARRPKK